MTLTGVHLLLTYQCTLECDHCFVWGSPRQSGVMSLATLREILRQARELGTVEWIYFEGGEPFLFHPLLARGVEEAAGLGFRVGIVTNGYWATGADEAREWLRPLAGKVQDLSLSRDDFHGDESQRRTVAAALAAAAELGIPTSVLTVCPPGDARAGVGQIPEGESAVMFRGRAAVTLTRGVATRAWEVFTSCPHEDLREPGRVHVDPFGLVHLCQGVTIGNLLETPLRDLCARFDPDRHAIAGPLLAGGPSELARRYAVPHRRRYADACHLCYETRVALRPRFPDSLGPDSMYGCP